MKQLFLVLFVASVISCSACAKKPCDPQEVTYQNVERIVERYTNWYTVLARDKETKAVDVLELHCDTVTIVQDVSAGEPMWIHVKYPVKSSDTGCRSCKSMTVHIRSMDDIDSSQLKQ